MPNPWLHALFFAALAVGLMLNVLALRGSRRRRAIAVKPMVAASVCYFVAAAAFLLSVSAG